jgi:FtsP/CotA-like multicopper oxidase with cupredoxin domain
MKLVGSDGGKLERETWVESVVIAPSERYVVDVRFDSAGTVALENRVQALDHMFGVFFPEVDTLGTVVVGAARAVPDHGGAFDVLRRNADVAAELAPFREHFDRGVDRELVLQLRTRDLAAPIQSMLTGLALPVDWNDAMAMLNWATTSNEVTWVLRDPATGAENMDIDWRFRVGDVVKLRIANDATASHAMAHPIHLHGQRFLVVGRDGRPNDHLVWKDTAVIPVGEAVDVLVEMSNPGRWMLHCHIAEHLGAGMQMVFEVR